MSLSFKYDALSNHWVKFNPENPFEIACNGERRMSFLSWEHGKDKFDHYSPRCEKGDFSHRIRWEAKYTKTVFIPGGNKAVTGTERGDILVWDQSLIIEGVGEENEKRLIKVVTLNQEVDKQFFSID